MLNSNSLTVNSAIGRSEYGRVKVALPRGKGLMDWVRMTAGKVVAKVRMPSVDHVELMKHNSEKDCWVHLFGQVFDITSYLDFHPGGVPELMRAAGRDATQLFNEYHAWVNYESMLKSCLVGKFSGNLNLLPPCDPSTLDISSNKFSVPVVSPKIKNDHGVKVSVQSTDILLTCSDWTSLSSQNIAVQLCRSEQVLRVLVRHFKQVPIEITWEAVPEQICSLNYRVETELEKIRLIWEDASENFQDCMDNARRTVKKRPGVKYYKAIISEITSASHDTLLFKLLLPKGVYLDVPAGHHVSVKVKKKSATLYRPYTPIRCEPPSCSSENGTLDLLIKVYPDGICTPCLNLLGAGDSLEISDPIGELDYQSFLPEQYPLFILAAGTGVAPMIPILALRRVQHNSVTKMTWFNKTEEDIYSEDIISIPELDGKIHIDHVLSRAESSWKGKRGRVSREHVPKADALVRVLVCGPDGFMDACRRLLEDAGFHSHQLHFFQS